jgi:hypothetical protein
MLAKMQRKQARTVVFETDDACICGSEFAKFNDSSIYLYVGRSMDLATIATAKMTGRMILNICTREES